MGVLQAAVDDFSTAKMVTALAAADKAADAVAGQLDSVGLSSDDAAVMMGMAGSRANDLRDALAEAGIATTSLNLRMGNLAGKAGVLTAALVVLDGELDKKRDALAAVGVTGGLAAVALNSLAANTDSAGASAQRSYGWWRLTGNAIHWIVMGTLEIASTAIPALVALGAAAVAMTPAFTFASDQMHNLVIASGSLTDAIRNSPAPLHDLAAGLGQVQQAATPDAFIILGSAISIATAHTGVFTGMAQKASDVLATFATKIVTDLQGPAGAAMAGFFQNAVKYMVQWGQVLGNLGHAFLNAVNSMWGVGQILLDVLVKISQAFLAITSNPVGAFLVGLAAAMSALYRYGRLVVTIFNWLGGSALIKAASAVYTYIGALIALTGEEGIVVAATTVMGDLMSVALGPVGIAIAAIAAGLGIWYIATHHAADATARLIQQVQSMPPTVQNLSSGIVRLSESLASATSRFRALGGTHPGWFGEVSAGALQAALDARNLTVAIGQQEQKLIELRIGLAQLGSTTGQVGHDMLALSVSTDLADSKVTQLTQAWDQYIGLVTGGTSALGGMSESLLNIGKVTVTSTDALKGYNASVGLTTSQAAAQMKNFGAIGSQVWQNFNSTLTGSMQPLADWLQTAKTAGAISGPAFSRSILDMASGLVKFAADSRPAQAELVAFAQQAGLNISTFPQLEQAIRNTGASTGDLTKKVTGTTIAMGQLNQIARNLSATLSTQETQAIAAAALKTSGFTTDLNNMMTAQRNNATVGGLTWQQWAAKAAAAQSSAQSAAQRTTDKLLAVQKAAQNAQAAISAMHGKNLQIGIDIREYGAQQALGVALGGGGVGHPVIPGHAAGTSGARKGWAWTGEQGPELVHFRGGEQVIPAMPSAHLAALSALSRRHVGGYAAGTSVMDQIARDLTRLFGQMFPGPKAPALMPGAGGLLSELRKAERHHDISAGEESRLARFIRSDNDRLDRLAAERAKVLAKIRAAGSYASGVASAAAGTASLSTIMGTAGTGPVSSSFLLASMRIDLAGIKRFDSDIRRLEKLGLDRALLNQIIQMGPVQGDQMAQALISGPLSNIKALNATESQVSKASKALGQTAAEGMYGSAKDAGKGFLAGLESQQHAIEALMRKIARDMVRTLRHELGIHSESAVTREMGHHLIDGLSHGVQDRLPSLDSALRGASAHVPSALGAAASAGGGGEIVVHNHIVLEPKLDGRALWRSTRTQSLRINRRNPDNRMSLTRGRGR